MASPSCPKSPRLSSTLLLTRHGSEHKDILDALDFIKERMETKADVAELRLELNAFRTEAEKSARELHSEISEINKRLDGIEQDYANLRGVTKEIDTVPQTVVPFVRRVFSC